MYKGSIAHLGANKTESSVCQIAQALETIQPVLDTFDNTNNINSPSELDWEASNEKDFRNTLDILLQQSVFVRNPERRHSFFGNIHKPLHTNPHQEIIEWIKEHAKCYFENSII